MDVVELLRLADWYTAHSRDVRNKYKVLVSVLQNNAQQASKQPVAPPLDDLSKALTEMPTGELSVLQYSVLDDLEVGDLVGRRGKKWLNKKIRTSTYDPATTFETINDASQKLSRAQEALDQFREAITILGFEFPDFESSDEHPYWINISFKDNAAIVDVRDWKRTSAEWELILSGVAEVCGSSAEEIKVVGASNGSIIYTLAAAPLVTKVLATISKHIASMGNDYLDFQLKREELARSKMMSEAIKKDLEKQERERREDSTADLLASVQKVVPNAPPEAIEKLKKGVEKQIEFSTAGGEIDFMDPWANGAVDDPDSLSDEISEIRDMLIEYRVELQKTKLLTKPVDSDEDHEGE